MVRGMNLYLFMAVANALGLGKNKILGLVARSFGEEVCGWKSQNRHRDCGNIYVSQVIAFPKGEGIPGHQEHDMFCECQPTSFYRL